MGKKNKMSYHTRHSRTSRKKEEKGGGREGQGEKTRGGWKEGGETRKEIVVGQTAPVRYDASVCVISGLRS